MLALSCLSVGLVPHAAVRTQLLVQAQPPLRVSRRAPPPQAHAAAIYESSQMATTVQLGLDPTVISDTLLDLGVYGLLALTVGLTLYSIYVTLDESNKKARPTPSTLTPTGLPTVRAGYAHQPAACCCTHRRRRAACLGGPRTVRRRARTGLWRAFTHDEPSWLPLHLTLTLTRRTGGWLDEP